MAARSKTSVELGGSFESGRTPLYRTVFLSLQKDIYAGAFKPGASLPSEKDLERQFGVSRITVRRAIDELSRAGLIHRSAGRASRVAEPRLIQAAVAFESPDVMATFLKGLRSEVLGFKWGKADEEISRILRVEPGANILKITRLRHHSDVPVLHTVGYLPEPIGHHISRKAISERSLYEVLADEGFVPAASERRMSAVPCPTQIAAHLKLKEGEPAFLNNRLSWDAKGNCLHLQIGHWRWDKFTIRFVADTIKQNGGMIMDAIAPAESSLLW